MTFITPVIVVLILTFGGLLTASPLLPHGNAADVESDSPQSDSPQSGTPQSGSPDALEEAEPGTLGISTVLGGETVTVWSPLKFQEIFVHGNSSVSLETNGQLYAWGELATDEGSVILPLPTHIEVPEGTPVDHVGVFDGTPLLILEDGELVFTEVRFDEAASVFSVSLFPEVENPFDPTDLSVDCEPPYLSFQAQGVRNSQGVRCYLLMDEHDARHSKGSVAVPGEVIAETVWTTAEWYYLTESGKIFQPSFPHLELRQLFTNTLNPTGQLDWKAIVPIGANLGVQAVSEDGQELLISTFHIHDAPESGVANAWSNTELSEYCYNLNTDGSMERRECSPTTYNMELQPFDLEALSALQGNRGRANWKQSRLSTPP